MDKHARSIYYFVFSIAMFGLLGSLYFSDILHFQPCTLCWYQRILLYPLAVIIPVGLILKDKKLFWYVLPLSSIGVIIAFYHTLLYYGIIPEPYTPCSFGVSCKTKYIELFGFASIPLLSLFAFSTISASMFYLMKGKKV